MYAQIPRNNIVPCSARRVMLFIFALPVMQVILFCLAIGRDPTGLKLAIVNHEMFYENMSCPVTKGCNFSHLSCRYLNFLDNETMVKVPPDHFSLQSRHVTSYHIPYSFSLWHTGVLPRS